MFTEDECLIIADFYAKNKTIFDSSSRRRLERLAEANALYRSLTDIINASSSKSYSTKQVRQKLATLKKDSKRKSAANKTGLRVMGGGGEKEKELSEAELMISEQFRSTPAYDGAPGGSLERMKLRANSAGRTSANRITSEGQFAETTKRISVGIQAISSTAAAMQGMVRLLGAKDDAYEQEPNKPRSPSPATDSARSLQMDVLQLQQNVYREMKSATADFKNLVSEARAMIYEQRLCIRGHNVASIALDVPVGLHLEQNSSHYLSGT